MVKSKKITKNKKLSFKDKLALACFVFTIFSFIMVFITSLDSTFFYFPFVLIPLTIILTHKSKYFKTYPNLTSSYKSSHRSILDPLNPGSPNYNWWQNR